MPRKGKSLVENLYKNHSRACTNKTGEPTQCSCPWYFNYKRIRGSLAKWARCGVDPHSKSHAKIVLNKVRHAIDEGKFSPVGQGDLLDGAMTLAKFIGRWKTDWALERNLSLDSLDSQLGVIEVGLGQHSLVFLSAQPKLIENWLNGEQKRREWKAATWNDYRGVLSRLFSRAVKWKAIERNPILNIDPKVEVDSVKSQQRLVDDAEARLLAACDQLAMVQRRPTKAKLEWNQALEIRRREADGEPRLALAQEFSVSLPIVCQIAKGQIWNPERFKGYHSGTEMRRRLIAALDIGLRSGEMQDITLSMVDYTPRVIQLRDGGQVEVLSITLPAGVTKGGKVTGREQLVFAGTERMRQTLIDRRDQLKENPADRQYVFGREDGSHQEHFDRSWHRLFALAGLDFGRDKGLVWHSLRHEFISRVAESTEDVNAARELARHADIRTTQRYMHTSRERLFSIAAEQGQAADDKRRADAAKRSHADVTPDGIVLKFPA